MSTLAGISGQITIEIIPKTAVPKIMIPAAAKAITRTTNPTPREIRLSKTARSLSAIVCEPVEMILRHGSNSVRKRIGTENPR